MNTKNISRRDFLRLAGVGGMALLGGRFNIPGQMEEPFMPDAEVRVTAAEKYVQILSGAQPRVWSYSGELLSGNGVTVQNLPGNYLGPILRVKKGTKLRMYFDNHLAEDSVIHPHGLRVPELR